MRSVLSALAALAAGACAWGDDPAPVYQTGARPSPPAVLQTAPHFLRDGKIGAPAQFCRIPDRVHIWGNNRYGDCVTAEEAFSKITAHPHVWVSEQEVIDWARRNNVLNGATLSEVLDEMRVRGLLAGDGKRYQDGKAYVVDYRDKATLCEAIYKGPVKIAVASAPLIDSLNRNGGKTGWAGIGYRVNNRTDHCTAYLGYGPAEFLYAELAKKYPEAKMPANVKPDEFGLLMFTWGTIGFIDWDSHLAICREGWVRDPTTDGFPEPAPQPEPPPTPIPDPTPGPTPAPPDGCPWKVPFLVGLGAGVVAAALGVGVFAWVFGGRLRKVFAVALVAGAVLGTLGAATASAQGPAADPPRVGRPSPSVADPFGAKSYAAFFARVNREGGYGVLYVGVPDESAGSYVWHYRVESKFGGLADGVYDCWHDAAKCEAVMTRRTEPAVPAPKLSAEDWQFYLGPPNTSGQVPQGYFGGSNCSPRG